MSYENVVEEFNKKGCKLLVTKKQLDQLIEAKKSGKGPNRTHAQLKHLVERLRDDVGEMLSLLAEKNEIYAN